jgi:hypothetical protein
MKIDIEGAEFNILNKMIEDGSINFIDRIYIEWHYKKIPSITEEQHSTLLNNISKNIPIYYWDALND